MLRKGFDRPGREDRLVPKMPGKRVRLHDCPSFDRHVKALRLTDLDAARKLARLLFNRTTGRVVAESARTVTLVFRGSDKERTVPKTATRTAKQ